MPPSKRDDCFEELTEAEFNRLQLLTAGLRSRAEVTARLGAADAERDLHYSDDDLEGRSLMLIYGGLSSVADVLVTLRGDRVDRITITAKPISPRR